MDGRRGGRRGDQKMVGERGRRGGGKGGGKKKREWRKVVRERKEEKGTDGIRKLKKYSSFCLECFILIVQSQKFQKKGIIHLAHCPGLPLQTLLLYCTASSKFGPVLEMNSAVESIKLLKRKTIFLFKL